MKVAKKLPALALGTVASLGFCGHASAQSADALIDKLVEKGILNTKEATDLRQETDDGFTKAYSLKSGMPDWVTSLKFNGDFRGRFEENDAHDNTAYRARDRYRYRVRFGITATLADDFEVGLRLASGNFQTAPGGALVGGQPITANTDLGSLGSRKPIWVDAAYAKWTPIHTGDWTASVIIGKMDNPFQLSNMVWDYDIAPEGAAIQLAYNINSNHVLKMNSGAFVLDELNQGFTSAAAGAPAGATLHPEHDPWMYGSQLLLESKWTPSLETSLGIAIFDIANKDSLSGLAQPLYNAGNSRLANGTLKYDMNPIIGTASATYKFDKAPLYGEGFPIKLMGEYMENPNAPSNNVGYRAGVTLGKAGKKGLWEISYRYQRLEADSWFDALVDDDNGAFYATGNKQLVGTGKANGWLGGTNVKGNLVQATYNFTDFMNFTFTYYFDNELIIKTAKAPSSSSGHFMADVMWKF